MEVLSNTAVRDVLILGGGPAGLAAAVYARRAGHGALVLERLQPGGQVNTTPDVENYPGIRAIEGWTLSHNMAEHARALGAEIVTADVVAVSCAKDALWARTTDKTYEGRALILAMGASRRKLGIEGEARLAGRGVSYCATCDGFFFKGRDVAVVGGGNTALEDAVHLSALCKSVTLIHRRDAFRGVKSLEDAVRARENVRLCLSAVPEAIVGENKVEGISVRRLTSDITEVIPVDAVFVAVGTQPETALVRGQIALDDAGYVVAGEDTVTSAPGVFAAGDLRRKPLYQIVTAAADGAVAATMAARYLQND